METAGPANSSYSHQPNNKPMKTLFSLLLLALSSALCFAGGTMYKIPAGKATTSVIFESEAPLENVIGRTQTVTGYIEIPAAPGDASGRSEIHVDLASLTTGISLRDKHMRENHLQTDKYPEAVFVLTSMMLPETGILPGTRTEVKVTGNLTLHGVTKEITPVSHLTLDPNGGSLHLQSEFSVTLQDYQIDRPQFLVMKLAEEQKIKVDIVAFSDDIATSP